MRCGLTREPVRWEICGVGPDATPFSIILYRNPRRPGVGEDAKAAMEKRGVQGGPYHVRPFRNNAELSSERQRGAGQ